MSEIDHAEAIPTPEQLKQIEGLMQKPSASVGMEPVAFEFFDTYGDAKLDYYPPRNREFKGLVYAEQLATLQTKLEQLEKDKAELVDWVRNASTHYSLGTIAKTNASVLIAKYEVKK